MKTNESYFAFICFYIFAFLRISICEKRRLGRAPTCVSPAGANPPADKHLFRRSRLDAQVVMLDLARLGRRHMGKLGEAVEHPGDAEVA
jgi:hypothetical protein